MHCKLTHRYLRKYVFVDFDFVKDREFCCQTSKPREIKQKLQTIKNYKLGF